MSVMSVVLVPIGLLSLFFSKKWLTLEIGRLIHQFGGGRHTLIVIWSIIFLPGTVIHELSHFFFAIITGARTGKIEIIPEYLEDEWQDEGKRGKVALGYVQTQRLNPIQGFFVGTAPFFVGTVLLVWLASLLRTDYDFGQTIYLVLQGYLFFTIANSFFPSWSDIKQTLPVVIIALVTAILAWTLGLQILIGPNSRIIYLSNTIVTTLLISVAINLILCIILFFVNHIQKGRR
jgi:hypothetical protein